MTSNKHTYIITVQTLQLIDDHLDKNLPWKVGYVYLSDHLVNSQSFHSHETVRYPVIVTVTRYGIAYAFTLKPPQEVLE